MDRVTVRLTGNHVKTLRSLRYDLELNTGVELNNSRAIRWLLKYYETRPEIAQTAIRPDIPDGRRG